MRLPVVLLCAALMASCARKSPAPFNAGPPTSFAPTIGGTNRNVVVTLGQVRAGRVAAVNTAGRFAVLTFPLGTMPPLQKHLNVYRGGLKIGEVKITGPQLDINIDADLIAGECQVGDEVRED